MSALVAENPRAVIGGNAPPEPTPFEIAQQKVDDIYGEAELWLDGAKVQDQATADGIGNLLTLIREAKDTAEISKETEYRPHKTAADAVTAKYKPLLARAGKAAAACKAALAPWLQRLADEIEAKARTAREEAEAKRRAAEEAIRAADAANLAERAAAEQLIKDAKRAEKIAAKAENQTATAGGDFGRSIGLRPVYTAVLVDERAAVLHYWKTNREEMVATLQTMADRDVRNGKHARDAIPGFRIDESKVAV